MVKYGRPGGPRSSRALRASRAASKWRWTDYDVEPFDPTRAPDADVTLPIEARTPAGSAST